MRKEILHSRLTYRRALICPHPCEGCVLLNFDVLLIWKKMTTHYSFILNFVMMNIIKTS